jgi:hypothetical protein
MYNSDCHDQDTLPSVRRFCERDAGDRQTDPTAFTVKVVRCSGHGVPVGMVVQEGIGTEYCCCLAVGLSCASST